MTSKENRLRNSALSRRSFLNGAALGGAAAWAGCAAPVAAKAPPPIAKAPPAPAGAPAALPEGLFGPPRGIAQLSRNENPYGPSAKVYRAVEDATRSGAYYASPEYLQAMIAERHGISEKQVSVSHGSGEALCAVALAWGRKGTTLAPDLFWDTTALYAVRQGAKIRRVPMTDSLEVDLPAIEASIDEDTALVHLCNPNNPTGRLIESGSLHAFCRRVSAKATILIDEAYNELTDDPERNTVMDLVREGQDIIVARTFSKIYGMAGMRIGYVMSSEENIAHIRQHQMSWMSAPSIAAAVAAYDDREFLAHSKSMVLEARAMVSEAVTRAGLKHLPSATNFVYVDVRGDAEAFRQRMEQRGVLIRGIYRDYTPWSRVSMGRIEDVKRYVSALPAVVASA